MGSVPNTTTSVNSGTPAFSVAIVGGGIGGVSLALGLLKYPHIDVQVYESAPAFGEIGAGVAFGPNAQRALELIGPSANHAFLKHATPNLWPFSANVFAHHIVGYGEHSGKLIHSQTNATGMQSVHRAHFLDELIKGVPAHRAHFNKRLTAVEDQKDVVKLSFKDGTSTTVNAVIGADGVHSVVRDHLLGSSHKFAKAAYTGMAVYRGLVSMDAAVEKLGAEFAQNCVILCGPDKAIMSYPIDHGEILNIVFMDFHHGEWKSDKAIIPADREVFKHFVDGWYEKAQGLDELVDTSDLALWSLWDMPPAPSYNRGRVAMMGDAAHATVPFQGQGAGQAIEDALVLETLLGKVTESSQIPNALSAYDQVRRPRSEDRGD